jgi:hypothetical protein
MCDHHFIKIWLLLLLLLPLPLLLNRLMAMAVRL